MKELTVFEETVMLAIFRLKEDAYSVSIHKQIFEMTGKDVILGTLFNALKQLNRKGNLSKKKGNPMHEKGGKSIMFYRISDEGLKALEESRNRHNKVWEEIPEVLYKGN